MDLAERTNQSLSHASTPAGMIARVAATSIMASLAAAGLVLCARRAAGALAEPAGIIPLAIVALVLAGAALGFRCLLRASAASTRLQTAAWGVPSVVIATWLFGLTLGGTSVAAVVLLVGILLAEEGWSWARFAPSRAAPVATGAGASFTEQADEPLAESEPASALRIADDAGETPPLDESTSQSIVRRREDAGEVLDGWLRVEFAAGQRVAAAHLAICPPLARVPVCYVEQADGPAAQVKVTQAMTYGMRCEVKLDEPAADRASVVVEFSIQEPAAQAGGNHAVG